MGNAFVHIELTTDDVSAAKQFYKSLFDWKLKDAPEMSYTMVDVGKGTGGGMMKKPMPQAPTAWTPYVEVADVVKTLDKARNAGAQVIVERQEIGQGMGAFGIFMDPAGAVLGVYEMAPKKPAARKAKRKPAAAKKKATKKGKR